MYDGNTNVAKKKQTKKQKKHETGFPFVGLLCLPLLLEILAVYREMSFESLNNVHIYFS